MAVIVLLAHALAQAQEKQGDEQQKPGDAAGEVLPEMKAPMMPGPAHHKLGKLVGEWTMKSKLTAADAPPECHSRQSRMALPCVFGQAGADFPATHDDNFGDLCRPLTIDAARPD